VADKSAETRFIEFLSFLPGTTRLWQNDGEDRKGAETGHEAVVPELAGIQHRDRRLRREVPEEVLEQSFSL
jgi:hypothetical protein